MHLSQHLLLEKRQTCICFLYLSERIPLYRQCKKNPSPRRSTSTFTSPTLTFHITSLETMKLDVMGILSPKRLRQGRQPIEDLERQGRTATPPNPIPNPQRHLPITESPPIVEPISLSPCSWDIGKAPKFPCLSWTEGCGGWVCLSSTIPTMWKTVNFSNNVTGRQGRVWM